jgi:hypothetical protein
MIRDSREACAGRVSECVSVSVFGWAPLAQERAEGGKSNTLTLPLTVHANLLQFSATTSHDRAESRLSFGTRCLVCYQIVTGC